MNRIPTAILALLVVASAFAGLAAAQSGNATLSFQPQSSGGRTVMVAYANMPEPGFMAIHDSTLLSAQDPFGSVVGVSEHLTAGNHTELRITLTRALRGANETLIAMPHKDTNGNGIYDFVHSKGAQDGPFVGGPQAVQTFAGNIVVAPAQVNVTASVHAKTPQVSAGNSVVVEHVELSQAGFLAIHDSTLVTAQDPFGSVIGVTFLEAGVHHNVLVEFNFNQSKRNVTGPVVPMPHKDTNGNRQYDFVSSKGAQDGPFAGDVPTFVGPIVIQVVDLQISRDAGVNFTATSTGGRLIVVPRAFLPEDGFVALHDSTLVSAQDPFGSVLGVSARLPAGLHHNVSVELGPVPGNNKPFTSNASDTVIAMPHKDSNDNGVYDFVTSKGAQDGPFVGGANATQTFAGNIVIAAANVTRSSMVVFTPQTSTDGRSVRIDAVDLSEGGFLALHDLSLVTKQDPFGSVVGISSKLNAGLHRNVTVTFGQNIPGANKTGPLNTSQTLVAMPHKDTNNNGVYDFITSKGAQDGPFPGTVPTFVGNLNIALGRVTTPVILAQAQQPPTTTPATPTPTTGTPATGTPATGTPATGTPAITSPATGVTPVGTSPAGSSPATTSPATGTSPATTTPATTGGNDSPGFGIVALVGALAVALLVMRRKA